MHNIRLLVHKSCKIYTFNRHWKEIPIILLSKKKVILQKSFSPVDSLIYEVRKKTPNISRNYLAFLNLMLAKNIVLKPCVLIDPKGIPTIVDPSRKQLAIWSSSCSLLPLLKIYPLQKASYWEVCRAVSMADYLPAKPYLFVYELTKEWEHSKNVQVQCPVLAIAAPLVRQREMYVTTHRL